jgi:hypothetical protein
MLSASVPAHRREAVFDTAEPRNTRSNVLLGVYQQVKPNPAPIRHLTDESKYKQRESHVTRVSYSARFRHDSLALNARVVFHIEGPEIDRRTNLAAGGTPKRGFACQTFGDLSSWFGGSPSAHNNNQRFRSLKLYLSGFLLLFHFFAFVVVMLPLDLASLDWGDIR